jgi:serine/threonine protein kinase
MALASRNWLAGAELGDRFDDVRLLHAGSRFTVYEGHEAATNRSVVIKTPDEVGATWLHDVLEQEARVLARIGSHPNIVTLFERIHLDDGRPALVMERYRDSLDDALRGGERISLETATSIGIKLAGALETVHKAGVLHCDVRPQNVLISDYGEPVLAGFDEAVDLNSAVGHAPMHVTTTHTAPEMLEGKVPGTATDVYGLASTLYELITGRAAFRAYVGESPATVIVRVLSGTVKPIVSRDVPIEVSDLLTWAMSPDPNLRPPTPAWFAEELSRIERREGWPRTRLVSR